MIRRRELLLGAGLLTAASIPMCSDVLDREAFSARYSSDELPSRDPIFDIEEELPLTRGSTAAFIANSRSELRSHVTGDSPILQQYADKQGVEFLTVVVVVLPNRSRILIDSLNIHDRTVSVNVRSQVSPEVENNELAYHRRLLYWTRDWPAVREPTKIRVVVE